MQLRSLKTRLSIGLSISLLIIFLIALFSIYHALVSLGENSVSSRVEHDIDSLLSQIAIQADGRILLDENAIDSIYKRPFSGHYFLILSGDYMLRSRSLWDQDMKVPELNVGDSRRLSLNGPQQQPLLVEVRGFEKKQKILTIAVAEDLGPLYEFINAKLVQFTLISLGIFCILVIWQLVLVHSGLRFSGNLRHQVKQLEAGLRTHLDENVPDEILPLVKELNLMFNRLDQRLARSRRGLGDLAHSLKTPLTLLRQISENESLATHQELATSLNRQIDNMQQTIERVLKRSRLAGAGPSTARFNPAQDIPALFEVVSKVHHDKILNFHAEAMPDMNTPLDREDGLELFGNLLDNAAKWAAGEIWIDIHANHSLVIRIEDDGPGVSNEIRNNLAQPGVRADERVKGDGLGLSIVKAIVDDYHGEMSFSSSSKLEGLSVQIRFPIQWHGEPDGPNG